MIPMKLPSWLPAILLGLGSAGVLPGATIRIERLPAGGLQPEVAVDASGTAHWVWLSGEPGAADVYYRRVPAGPEAASPPLRVNQSPGSGIAIGTVRGARVALGRGGWVHVLWNGSATARPTAPAGSPLLYSRMQAGSPGFEPERNLLTRVGSLDGGAAVAADPGGGVFVLFHGSPLGSAPGESHRRVFLSRSRDDGRTFEAERPVGGESGVCGCCGLAAQTAPDGTLHALFRSARDGTHREAVLLTSRDQGASFQSRLLQDWETASCPMSTTRFLPSVDSAPRVDWETRGSIQSLEIGAASLVPTAIAPGPGAKHPSVAVNRHGEILHVWTEGTGWQRGGRLAWKLTDAGGAATLESGSRPGIVPWNFAACYARPDGSFVILY